jgi:hypothetical protein
MGINSKIEFYIYFLDIAEVFTATPQRLRAHAEHGRHCADGEAPCGKRETHARSCV